jgi:ActR/RegA family two-component response regulator
MPAPARPRPTESKFRILYLGSDLEMVKALRRVLTKPDYRLVTCADRDTALLFLKSAIPYALLLVDLEWRDGEGLKLARLAPSQANADRLVGSNRIEQ